MVRKTEASKMILLFDPWLARTSIVLEPELRVPAFFLIEKNNGTHDDGDSFVWSPFSRPEFRAEVAPRSRKQMVSGTTNFLDYLHFWRPLFGHFCTFWNLAARKRFRSWISFFVGTDLCYLRFIFSRKNMLSFVERKSAESLEDHPRQKGTAHKENPGPAPLPGKKEVPETY